MDKRPEMDAVEAGLRMVRNPDFVRSEKFQEQQWRADRKGADSEILDFERLFVRRFAKLGVPMFAHCVVRPVSEQDRLFSLGRSKAKGGQSPHNYGFAVDLIHGIDAWDLHRETWALIGRIGKEVAAQAGIDIEWGGDWKFYDPAHWELRGWKSRDYPDLLRV